MTIDRHHRRSDAVEDDDSIRGKHGENLRHNVLQTTAVASDEDGIGTRQRGDVSLQEITHTHLDTRGTETTGILTNQGLALGTDLKRAHLEMGELQTGLDGDTARAETDVPEDPALGEFEGL